MNVTIYHNPHCSKSRQTLALLRDKGIEPVIVEYLKRPPDPNLLRDLLDKLGMEPRELMRTHENEYQSLGLDHPNMTSDALIDAMSKNPRLIERPIVVAGDRAAIGRPPENVLRVL